MRCFTLIKGNTTSATTSSAAHWSNSMTDNHPITPPPELVEQWHNEAMLKGFRNKGSYYGHELAIQAARWGADQELEACCKWQDTFNYPNASNLLRAARRPKPEPSLKEQALMALEDGDTGPGASLTSNEVDIIRRALNQLDD
jgi:hypothetical protein